MIAMPVMAQDQAPVSTSDGAGRTQDQLPVTMSEEIVVTAQNRAENVQDVPIALQVVSGDALEKAGVADISGIQQLAPAVQIVQVDQLRRCDAFVSHSWCDKVSREKFNALQQWALDGGGRHCQAHHVVLSVRARLDSGP